MASKLRRLRRCGILAAAATATVADSHRQEKLPRFALLRRRLLLQDPTLRCSSNENGHHFDLSDLILKHNGGVHSEYEIEGPIGRGGFGQVYAGIHKRTQMQRAIKCIPKRTTSESEFEAEVQALSDIDHPHIVKLVEYFEDANNFYLVQELCEGPDLVEFINQQADADCLISEKEVSVIVRQCLMSVLGCHAAGFIHRDIKLDNFIISGRDRAVKMIDFGLATRFFPDATFTKEIGTVHYRAPEMLAERQDYDGLVDEWSLGVVMYLLLTGEFPVPNVGTIDIGSNYEVKDCNGSWWPMTVQEKNTNGTFVVDVHDGRGTCLKRVSTVNIRREEDDLRTCLRDPRYIPMRLRQSSSLNARRTSHSARDLLGKLLQHDPKERITAAAALSHPFILQHYHDCLPGSERYYEFSIDSYCQNRFLEATIGKLRRFAQAPKLKQLGLLAMTHIATAQDVSEELFILRHLFREIDVNGDGEVSLEEITDFFSIMGVDVAPDLEEVYRACDSNGTGALNVVEFIAATMSVDKVDKKLYSEVFRLLDRTNSGNIVAQDLGILFRSSKFDAQERDQIIAEAESTIRGTGARFTGTLDFDDFHCLMRGPDVVS